MANQIKVTLKKSLIGRTQKQRAIIQSLGLRKINQIVVHNDTPQIRGMIRKMEFMLKVEEA